MIKKTCIHCGETFYASNPRKKYCSDKCKWIYQTRKQRATIPKGKRNCPICGKEMHGANKYCSPQCAEDGFYQSITDQYRPFTKDTVWLVKTWHNKGDDAKLISRVLVRPLEVIEGIIRGDYDEFERETIETTKHKRNTETGFDV